MLETYPLFWSLGNARASTFGRTVDASSGRLMIAVLSGPADMARDLIRIRTAERRSQVKARAAHESFAEAHATAAEGSTAATRRWYNTQGTHQELQCGPDDDFEAGA